MGTATGQRRGAWLLVALAMAAVACGDDGGDGDAASEPPAEDAVEGTVSSSPEVEVLDAEDRDFYAVPDPMPDGQHGDLVRIQPLPSPDGTVRHRIMYLSETLGGEPTVVTGIATVPVGEPPPEGWPLFSHAHGSTGLADACAPSVSVAGDGTHALELALLASHVASRGIAVVSTDYEGLGGPGLHPFLVGESEGRGVLDAALAAHDLPGARFTDEVGIVGYSQGGHAAAWANQIAPEWTPDLPIAGVLAGAPATEVVGMLEGANEAAGYLLVAALAASDDELDPESVLTEAGLAGLEQLDTVCQDGYRFDGPLLEADVTTTEPWASAIAANVPGDEPGAAPVLIVHSELDLNVPIEGSAAYQDRLCAAGQVVERRVLADGNHVSAAIPAYEQGIEWIMGLADGDQASSTCP